MNLSIGMAAHSEADNVWFVVDALRLYHGFGFDIVVVDTTPGQPSKFTADKCRAMKASYYHRPDLKGTAAPRDAVFRLAKTPWVCCIDSHVHLYPGWVEVAEKWIVENPESNDLVQGPLVYDDHSGLSSHWQPTHLPSLTGTWGLNAEGIKSGKPFEIPLQGLGQFMMRKAAWPGFHPLHRGFGGEEGYLHEKVRQRGGRALCHPGLGWTHKFRWMESGGPPPPYPLNSDDHLWNLLVGHRELGIDAAEQIKSQKATHMTPQRWEEFSMLAESAQPFGQSLPKKPRVKLLGIWYSNNKAPAGLIRASLDSIKSAADSCVRHEAVVSTCSWDSIPGNPFPWVKAAQSAKPGHATILEQQIQCVENRDKFSQEPDAIVFLEHDVLYPADYFDRIGDAFANNPSAPVVSNLDYEGLSPDGWQAVKERHEPLHQIAVRKSAFESNVARCKADCDRQGWCLLEPDSAQPPQYIPVAFQATEITDYTEVESGLFVGALVAEPPPGTTATLNVCDYKDSFTSEFHEWTPILDALENPPSLDWLRDRVKFIEQHRASDRTVFVHCYAGLSRSVMVVAAYLMKTRNWSVNVAVKYLATIRKSAQPNSSFMKVLREYEKLLGSRANWVRIGPSGEMPAIHVNYGCDGQGNRFTTHGSVCYAKGVRGSHKYWGDSTKRLEAMGCGCGNNAGASGSATPNKVAVKPVSGDPYKDAVAIPSDFNEHVEFVKGLADGCDHATEISHWHGKSTTIALGASKANRFVSWSTGNRPVWDTLRIARPGTGFEAKLFDLADLPAIEETDLLFLDTLHQAPRVMDELSKYDKLVRKYFVIHVTDTDGETSRDGGPGIMPAVREFLKQNPTWTVRNHFHHNHGLIVLSRLDEDKTKPPGLIRAAMNFGKASAKFLGSGGKVVSEEVRNKRLDLCMVCPDRNVDRCGLCSCFISAKTWVATEKCPADKWAPES